MAESVENYCIAPGDSVRHALETINRSERGVMALVVSEERRLLATLTDGDLRRGILAGYSLDQKVQELMDSGLASTNPITISAGTERAEMYNLLNAHSIHQAPLVDEEGRVVDVVILDEMVPQQILPVQAVIMAGGKGTRLLPLTENVPKPMLPVGDKPIMEHIVKQLRDSGINRLNVTTHYKPEQIKDHFGDGKDFGVNIRYVNETRPLGTAGAISLMEKPDEPLLVINGDILTNINFRGMVSFHRENEAIMTIAVREYDIEVPYGVVDTDGIRVKGCREKPSFRFFVNAGIYLLQPEACKYIPDDERFDMTELIDSLIEKDFPVISYPIGEYWLDIGKHDDYKRAQVDADTTINK